jgi:hypothetical protein
MSKKSFILHIDKLKIIKEFPEHLVGRFLLAVLEYQESGKVLDKEYLGEAVYYLFKGSFVPQFECDDKKYNDMIERNRKNGLKNTKKHTNERTQWDPVDANRPQSMPVDARGSLTDTVTDTVTDTNTVTNTVTTFKKENINKTNLTITFINPKEKDDSDVLQNVFEGEPSNDLLQLENVSEDQSSSKSLQLDEITEKPVKLPESPCFDLVATDAPKTKKKASGARKKGDSSEINFPDNFPLTDEMIDYAFEKADFASVDIDRSFVFFEFESFCIYWRTQRPTEKRKLESWDGTWKKWILKQIQDKKERMKRPAYSPRVDPKAQKKLEVMKSFEELDRMREEMEAETGRRLSLFKK